MWTRRLTTISITLCTTATLEHDNPWNIFVTLRWRHNERDGVSNHTPRDCLPNRLFRHRSKKTSKLRVTGLCARNLPVTGEFPAQMASNAENISIWWRNHELFGYIRNEWRTQRRTRSLLSTREWRHNYDVKYIYIIIMLSKYTHARILFDCDDMMSTWGTLVVHIHIDGWVQDCSNSNALAMELLQSCTKPSICYLGRFTSTGKII